MSGDAEIRSGLEGVVAFATQIAEPDREGGALRYRGVDIEDLVGAVAYERVWGLLVDGAFDPGLEPGRRCRCPCTAETCAWTSRPRSRCSPRRRASRSSSTSTRSAPATSSRRSRPRRSRSSHSPRGVPIAPPSQPTPSTARPARLERFLTEWRGEADPAHARAIDAYWISAAEHGMNASTFTARVVASTGADVAAALSAAVGALSGPLHGGAPARVLRMLDEVAAAGDARRWIVDALDSGERLMGFGHRVYRAEDPRARVLRRTAHELRSPRASRSPRPSRRPRWRSCVRATPTASSPPTSSSGRRSYWTSRRSRRRSSRRCSPARARPDGRRTSSSRSSRAA